MRKWHGGLHVCMGLAFKSNVFDSGSTVELKFELSPCHGIKGGQVLLWVSPEEAEQYEVGAEFSILIREM
jgi:hypothetical protein